MPEVTIDVVAKDLASEVLKQLGTSFEGIAGEALGVVSVFTALAAAEIALANSAAEAAQNSARLEISLRNAGDAVGITQGELENYATQLARSAGIEDDTIIKAEALAVTFGIQGDQIKKTLQAAADLSAMFGTDMLTETQKLGRAFQTFDGYTVLTRELGKFTPAQKAALDNFRVTNDLVGYQNYLLSILNERIGGTAEAVNAAGTGWAGMNVELKILTDNIGTLLLPEVKDLTHQLTELLRAINDNWQAISNLYNGLQSVYRVMVGISSLGLSEVFRAITRGINETPPAGSQSTSGLTSAPGFIPTYGLPGHASGGSFTIPSEYGYEGFRLGNYGTASGGERVTVTPAGAGGGMVTIGTLNIGNTASMGRYELTGMIEEAFIKAMGGKP